MNDKKTRKTNLIAKLKQEGFPLQNTVPNTTREAKGASKN